MQSVFAQANGSANTFLFIPPLKYTLVISKTVITTMARTAYFCAPLTGMRELFCTNWHILLYPDRMLIMGVCFAQFTLT